MGQRKRGQVKLAWARGVDRQLGAWVGLGLRQSGLAGRPMTLRPMTVRQRGESS